MNKIQRCSSTIFSLSHLIRSSNKLPLSSKRNLHTSLSLLCRNQNDRDDEPKSFKKPDSTAKEKAKSLTSNKSGLPDDPKDYRFKYDDRYDGENKFVVESNDDLDRRENDALGGLSPYDVLETVEEVRLRLRKESEIIHISDHSLHQYPAGFKYFLKNDRIYDLEKVDIKPFKDLGAPPLLISNVLIIGGGLLGTSVAYWLRELGTDMYDVNVIDRDFKHLYSNTGLTTAGLQQQFTTKECIQLSQASAEFLRVARRNLNVFNKEPPDLDYCPTGNLILAKSDNEVEQLLESVKMQNEFGQKTILLSKDQLKKQFPWLNTSDVQLGSIGLENEGHFNSQSLLRAMKIKAENLQARFWECEFVDFNIHLVHVTDVADRFLSLERCRRALIRDRSNELFQIDFDMVVICAGPENAKFGELLGMGYQDHPEEVMRFPLPLKKRKRYYYVFECEDGPGIDFPLLMDPSGVFCRVDGYDGRYICGKLPSENEEIDNNNSDVDYKYFENIIQPVLQRRVPAFKNLKLLRGWSCFEDVNTYDQMPLIGCHPFFENVIFVGGFGVHSAALAPGIGKAVAEMLLFDEYRSVDLTRFGWERFFSGYKFKDGERNTKF